MLLRPTLLSLLCLAAARALEYADAPLGWRMVDRFDGFRYEVPSASEAVAAAVVAKADELFCFGWVQATDRGTHVGEARCSKTAGKAMRAALKGQAPPGAGAATELYTYEDTKIKLHFSHFKTLEASRATCFREPPHQCPEFADAAAAAAGDASAMPGSSAERPEAEAAAEHGSEL